VRVGRFALRGGLAATALVLLFIGLVVLGVIPLRAYLGQQRDLRDSTQRLSMLREHNATLTVRAARLRTDAEVALIAREQFGMVPAGQKLTLLPGLRTPTTELLGEGRDAVRPVPPDTTEPDMSLYRSILDLLRFPRH
jgi:cell division protein FtsB